MDWMPILTMQNTVGYLSHSLVRFMSVSWHTDCSAWPIQDLPCPSLHSFVSFMALWSGLWGILMALKYDLTCSLSVWFALVGGLAWTSWTIFLERTRDGHHQSDEHWNHFKGNVGETSERWGGALYGLFWVREYQLELNWTVISFVMMPWIYFDRRFNLVLYPGSPVIGPNFKARTVDRDGRVKTFDVNPNNFYTGHLAGLLEHICCCVLFLFVSVVVLFGGGGCVCVCLNLCNFFF